MISGSGRQLLALSSGKQIEGDNGKSTANEKALSERREWKKVAFRDCLITSLSKCSLNIATNKLALIIGCKWSRLKHQIPREISWASRSDYEQLDFSELNSYMLNNDECEISVLGNCVMK